MLARIIRRCIAPSRFIVCSLTAFVAGGATATTIVVNSSADVEGNDNQCTLREAIKAANTNTVSGASGGECAAGQAFPTIDVGVR